MARSRTYRSDAHIAALDWERAGNKLPERIFPFARAAATSGPTDSAAEFFDAFQRRELTEPLLAALRAESRASKR